MCLAVPMQIVERSDLEGTAERGGVTRRVSLVLCPEARVGEYVLVHAGYAIGAMDAAEARRTLDLLDEAAREETRR